MSISSPSLPGLTAVSSDQSITAASMAAAAAASAAGFQGMPAPEDKRTKRGFSKRVTLRDLERYFEYPIEEVSRMMGVSTTIIKRLCRKYGIKRWPYRQIRSVNKSIKYVELLARTAQSPDRQRLQEQLVSLHYKKQLICQAATSGASAKVRKSILQMRPEELDADTLARTGMAAGAGGGGVGEDNEGEEGSTSSSPANGTPSEGETLAAAAAAAMAASMNPYGIPHLSMAGMAMGYSPYAHMAAAQHAAMAAAAVTASTAGGGGGKDGGVDSRTEAVAPPAPAQGSSLPQMPQPYPHLGVYGGYPGMMGMPFPFQGQAYPGMPGYGMVGMGGYPSLACGGGGSMGEPMSMMGGMNGMAAMQWAAHAMQYQQQLQQQQQLHQQQMEQSHGCGAGSSDSEEGEDDLDGEAGHGGNNGAGDRGDQRSGGRKVGSDGHGKAGVGGMPEDGEETQSDGDAEEEPRWEPPAIVGRVNTAQLTRGEGGSAGSSHVLRGEHVP